ncbi:sigma-70 family RNA polymerase sigma factor [Rossellomorea aquimaris]|uniref:sigma-70 family RNA polymerase sigma factor n=1 Tax=Rossellomorea aquimaris TaxID=189382 RepID=UPI001CD5A9CD|nr:sigma-70 family RNA polymerase sigma factor [Rossellomorea aquimaris]MCA1054198.1 sigma-70 family RNA polymerase sigma factor [Rossellomorea aquimaris]
MTNSAGQDFQEERSIRYLVIQYGEDVKRLIYSYVKNWSAAEDLVQEVFITVYQKMDTLENASSAKAWIFSIAANKSKDYLRSWHYRKLLLTNTFSMTTSKEGPEDWLMKQQQKTELSEAIFALPVKYREVIMFFYYQELRIGVAPTIYHISHAKARSFDINEFPNNRYMDIKKAEFPMLRNSAFFTLGKISLLINVYPLGKTKKLNRLL